jgi:uncharacterized protein YjiS (DUF1127 family)
MGLILAELGSRIKIAAIRLEDIGVTEQEAIQSVKANPRNPDAWAALGDALAETRATDKARESYQRALEIMPTHARSLKALEQLDQPRPLAAPWLTAATPEYEPELPRRGNGHAPDGTALAERQIQLLEAINQQLDELQRQQRQQVSALKTLADQQSVMLKAGKGVVDESDSGLPLVKVGNFDMPFMALVGFMVKAAIAAIPASIILAAIWFSIFFFLGLWGAMFGALLR